MIVRWGQAQLRQLRETGKCDVPSWQKVQEDTDQFMREIICIREEARFANVRAGFQRWCERARKTLQEKEREKQSAEEARRSKRRTAFDSHMISAIVEVPASPRGARSASINHNQRFGSRPSMYAGRAGGE